MEHHTVVGEGGEGSKGWSEGLGDGLCCFFAFFWVPRIVAHELKASPVEIRYLMPDT